MIEFIDTLFGLQDTFTYMILFDFTTALSIGQGRW